MAGSNDFTGQNIQDTYQRVLQLSSSGELADGTGSLVPLLTVTASHAISASHEITFELSSSYAQTASFANNFTASGNISASRIGTGGRNINNVHSSFDIACVGGIDTDGAMSCTGFSNSSTTTLGGRLTLEGGESFIQTPSYVSASRVIVAQITSSEGVKINGNLNVGSNVIFDQDLTVTNDTNVSNISASGHISASNVVLGKTSDSVLTIISDGGNISHEMHGRENQHSFLAIPINHNLGIGLPDTTQTPTEKLTVVGNISASGNLILEGDITASGNISASGTIEGLGYFIEGNVLADMAGSTIAFGYQNDTPIQIGRSANPIKFMGEVTASGNISASGDIIGGNDLTIIKQDGTPVIFTLNSPNDGFGRPFTITNDGAQPTINAQDILRLHADDGDVEIKLDASGQDKITFSTTPTGGGSILTERYKIDNAGNHLFSSNISASGEIKTDSHITASGNISASGRIYGRQFEQIETNFGLNDFSSVGNFIYLPFSNQSTTENTLSTNLNVNRVAVVPGKPIKSIMRATGNTLGNNTPYTMSYWEVEEGNPTTPILKAAVYADTDSDSNKDAVRFDWSSPNSGSTTDVAEGSRIYMSLESNNSANAGYIITHLWEWDYNSI